MNKSITFLCISFYYKGEEFLKACKDAGHTVYLLTKKSLENEWSKEAIDEVFFLEDDTNTPENFDNMAKGTAWLLRSRKIDRIVALDDFDVEKAAFLREAFRIPGMGQTTARYFRDKLAMRIKAAESGIPVPAFCALFNDEEINQFAVDVAPPWIIKPRSEASATGMKKVASSHELWETIHELGDERHNYLVEQFKPGTVYHVDALSVEGKVIFCRTSGYLDTPFEVAHGGGIFRSATLGFGSKEDKALQKLTTKVMKAFGMVYSASHTEFIQSNDDGKFYFLETASRVGGANLAEMVEASSGISLWKEWAKIEAAKVQGSIYSLPEVQYKHAGILISLSRFQHPDNTPFDAPEIIWRLEKEYHIGMLLRSDKPERIKSLLDEYAENVFKNYHASAPVPDKALD